MNDDWLEKLDKMKNADVQEFKQDNSILVGLTDKNIKQLYSDFSFMYSASWLTVDERVKEEFLKWCTTAPIDKFRKW